MLHGTVELSIIFQKLEIEQQKFFFFTELKMKKGSFWYIYKCFPKNFETTKSISSCSIRLNVNNYVELCWFVQ